MFPTPAWRAAMNNKHCQTWRTWWRVDGDGAAEPAAERSPRCKACNSSTQTIVVHSSHLKTPRNAAASSTTVTTPRPKHLNRSGANHPYMSQRHTCRKAPVYVPQSRVLCQRNLRTWAECTLQQYTVSSTPFQARRLAQAGALTRYVMTSEQQAHRARRQHRQQGGAEDSGLRHATRRRQQRRHHRATACGQARAEALLAYNQEATCLCSSS